MVMSRVVKVWPGALEEVNVRRWMPSSSGASVGVMSDGSSTVRWMTRPVPSRSVVT